MNVNDLLDYDTITITPREAETWEDLMQGLVYAIAEDIPMRALVCPQDAQGLLVVLSAGLAALENEGRIKA